MFLQMQVWAFWLLQEGAGGVPGWDVRSLWHQMGTLAKAVVAVLFIMSAWSIGVMIDRLMAFSAARKQSRQFAPAVAGALREGKLDEAVKIADRYKKSHLAKVVVAGLQEFQAHQISTEIPGEEIEASKRALERAEAIVHAELKRGISGLATIGSTAPFVGLFGTVVGIINAFNGISTEKSTGLGAVAGRHFRSPCHHRYRIVRRHPCSVDVQLLHGQDRSVRRGDGELELGVDRLFPEAYATRRHRPKVELCKRSALTSPGRHWFQPPVIRQRKAAVPGLMLELRSLYVVND